MRVSLHAHQVLVFCALSSFSNAVGANQPQLNALYGELPLSFEENQGQADPRAKFISRGNGYTLFLTSTEAVLSFRSTAEHRSHHQAVRLNLIGANPAPILNGLDALPGQSNYFVGSDPKKWHTDVSTFSKVKYQAVYPGIDLIYYGNQGRLEHDFIVAPGANPGKIRLSISGVAKPRIDAEGDLLLTAAGGEIVLHKPRIYQDQEGVRRLIQGRYVFKGRNQLGFEVAEYDLNRPLIIDPVLSYSTFLGAEGTDQGIGIAVDAQGNAYVTGATTSLNFPLRGALAQGAAYAGGPDDAFIAKLNPTGTALVYSTYLGGSGDDFGNSIAVDAAGNAYVAGQTASANFPTSSAAFQRTYSGGMCGSPPQPCYDAFVAKLNPSGNSLLYSTYLGTANADDVANSIAVDSAGNAYVTGQTDDPSRFPTTAGAFQRSKPPPASGSSPFVTKLNATGGALIYSTYLAGSNPELVNGIAVDSSGNAYVTGATPSPNFPVAHAFQPNLGGGGDDAFVAKLNADGSNLVYSTYLGGSGQDLGYAIAVDSSGNAYVTGTTNSPNFPTKNQFQAFTPLPSGPSFDAFVAKFDSAGALVYSTYLGGSNADRGFAIAVDSGGRAYVTGRTDSSDFPTARAFQATPGSQGTGDIFVTQLNQDGTALVYSSYLGGNSRNRAFGIALGPANNLYLTGFTDSTNFPTTGGVFQGAKAGGQDVIVTRIDDSGPDFDIALAGSGSDSASVNCGQTANYNLQAIAVNGFAGSVSLSCAIVVPSDGSMQGITCRESTNPINLAGAAVPFTVSVVTTGRSLAPPTTRFARPTGVRFPHADDGQYTERNDRRWQRVLLALIILSLLILARLATRTARHLRAGTKVAAAMALVLLTAHLTACPPLHAKPGQYTVNVTGTSQVLTRTLSLKLALDCPK